MNEHDFSDILVISSYPPRECGIATYSYDLIKALHHKFDRSLKMRVCALENESEKHTYPDEVQYVLNTSNPASYKELATSVNSNPSLKVVLIQHEFGFFHSHENNLLQLINAIQIPVLITFHTVLPHPDADLKLRIRHLAASCDGITVMTRSAAQILEKDYNIEAYNINVIAHGTHLVEYVDKELLKRKYGFKGRKILSTFGLISSGKSIETTLDALPAIIETNKDVLFLVIGKTHPTVKKHDGEKYRSMLEAKVKELKLEQHVTFINHYLPLKDLLEYLQLTDIYLFTSKDPNQAVSGTFSYAISCGCPVISTRIPHAVEVLHDDAGILIDFENAKQLSDATNRLLGDEQWRKNISSNGLHRIISTAWENAAIAHALLFEKFSDTASPLQYTLPPVNLAHIKNMTSDFGMFQFSKINHPDPESGYTLDDNARAMIAMCMHYSSTGEKSDVAYISRYLHFISHCMQVTGRFLNYVDTETHFTDQNASTNLDDANGRAIWALGYVISHKSILPEALIAEATQLIKKSLVHIRQIHSTRAVAFALKGLYYYHQIYPSGDNIALAETLGSRLERMYEHECDKDWKWFESYLTYGNGILPEGMLCAYLITQNETFKSVAKTSFDFLLSCTFTATSIKPISNGSWLKKGETAAGFGEQPIDVTYTILAFGRFYDVFEDVHYLEKLNTAFAWFLGNNHLHQIVYNPCTGGCYDGLEETHVNLNQGAESAVSYLMARLLTESYITNHIHHEIIEQHAE